MTHIPLYPFSSQTIPFAYGKLRYHFVDEGPRTKARAVLMLHGNPTWSFYYRNVIEALKGEHRCLVPDHMGCGLSDKPQDYTYTLKQHIENARSLVDRLEVKELDLVLHDWGGAIGMGLAMQIPERIRRIVVLNTAAFLSPRIPFRIDICRTPVLGDIAIRGLNAFARAALFMAVAHREKLTPDIKNGLLLPYDSWEHRIAILRFVQDIPMTPLHPTWKLMQEIEAALPQFKSRKMLICWGMKDWCFDTSFLKTWREKFPEAEVSEYADAGHYVLEDAWEQIAPKIAAFLR